MTEPLDEELAALLTAEKGFAPVPPGDVQARVLAAVEARVALLPSPGGGGGGDGGGGGGDGGHGGAEPRSALARAMGARPVAGLLGALLVGVAVGAAGMQAAAPRPSAPVTYIDREVPGPAVIEFMDPPPAPSVPPPLATSAAVTHAPLPPAPSIDAHGLAAERMLLDGARSALARGDAEASMAAVERHEHTYPLGALTEEREALAGKALAAAGRTSEARARCERFRDRFPRSVFLGSVNATLASLPK